MSDPGAPSRRPSHWQLVGAALSFFLLGLTAVVVLPLVVVSTALIAVWVGIPLLAAMLALTRTLAGGFRQVAGRVLQVEVPQPYRPVTGVGLMPKLRSRLSDPVTYRDLLWLLAAGVIAIPIGLISAVLYLIFPLGLVVSPMALRLLSTVTLGVLQPTDLAERQAMTERIGSLAQSRADAVDSTAAELRRIERDLHDGAQAHLVALSMNLGLAEQLLATDPAASKELIAESRAGAGTALTELRSLVRGIHPPVLSDRGLTGAVEALALSHPYPVEVDIELDGHPPAPVESALYFAVAEALTNSAKHAAAQNVWVWGRYLDGSVRLQVGDDGVGGATLDQAGGLAGTGKRLAAFDGTVSVASPLGGGTIVALEVPCELSSVRT